MMASVPSVAPGTPPDTGASRNRAWRLASAAATRRETPGSIVDMSTHSRPAATDSSTPPAPRYTASTCDEEGSMVTISSLRLTTSAVAPAPVAPSFTAAASEACTTSLASTANPFLMRFATIGCPIVPVPMNPICMVWAPCSEWRQLA